MTEALFGAKTVLKIVHSTSAPLVALVPASVINTKNILGEVGHHSKESNDPHPEYGSGST